MERTVLLVILLLSVLISVTACGRSADVNNNVVVTATPDSSGDDVLIITPEPPTPSSSTPTSPASGSNSTDDINNTTMPNISPTPYNAPKEISSGALEALKRAEYPIFDTDDDNMRISLTINCAWGADDIPQLLTILDECNVKATFFMLGNWAEANPQAVLSIYQHGHEIGNHSYSHRMPSSTSASALLTEIRKANDIIEQITGYRPILYRAPSGEYTRELLSLAAQERMFTIQWSSDSVDWREDMTREMIIERILRDTASGGILLFHNDTQHTLSVLPEIIEQLRERGFSFVRVSELIYLDNFRIAKWGKQVSA